MERLERLLHRHNSHRAGTDPEKQDEGPSGNPADSGRRPTSIDTLPPSPPPLDSHAQQTAAEQLRAFRNLVGITNDRSMKGSGGIFSRESRAAPNVGIYTRVVHNEKIAKTGYQRYSILINGCLGAQLIVAAALTAMGAADSSHQGITAFGAINTVIAGFLTYLKGSGLPSRLKYYQNEWKKLREYIEQRERDFSRNAIGGWHLPAGMDLDSVVATIEHMYNETKTDIEVNTPDGYTSLSKNTPRQFGAPPMPPQPNPVAIPPPAHISDPSSYLQRAKGAMGGVGGGGGLGGLVGKLQGALDSLGTRHHEENQSTEDKELPPQHGALPHERDNEVSHALEPLLPGGLTARLHSLSSRVEGGVATGTQAHHEAAQQTRDVARELHEHSLAVHAALRRVEALAGRLGGEARRAGAAVERGATGVADTLEGDKKE